MSDQPPAKKPRLSKFGSAHARGKAASDKTKNHSYDATQYHQNANRKGIHSLVKFDCPICHCKNTVLVDLDTKSRTATVRCTYCLSLKPRPAELPYPFTTTFTPKLENKADAFFRFSEKYRALVQQQQQQAPQAAGMSRAAGAAAPSTTTSTSAGLDGGLLGGLDDLLAASLAAGGEDEGGASAEQTPEPDDASDEPPPASDNRHAEEHSAEEHASDKGNLSEGEEEGGTKEEEDQDEDLVDDVDAFFNDD